MDDVAWLTLDELAAWRRLVTLLHHLPTALGAALAPHDLNFYDYMVMAMLSDAPDRTLSMGRLAALTNASPSRVSHAARRLEERGLVARGPDADDGRVTLATLTGEGLATMERVAPDHVASVRALVFDALDDDQVAQLAAISGTVLKRVIPDLAPPWADPPEPEPEPDPGDVGVRKQDAGSDPGQRRRSPEPDPGDVGVREQNAASDPGQRRRSPEPDHW